MSKLNLNSDNKIVKTHGFFNKKRAKNIIPLSPIQQYVHDEITSLIPKGTSDQKAVDLGCHWGRYTATLAETYGDVIGIDYAEKAIKSAIHKDNIVYEVIDLDQNSDVIAKHSPVDLYIAVALFEMLNNPTQLCNSMYNLSLIHI